MEAANDHIVRVISDESGQSDTEVLLWDESWGEKNPSLAEEQPRSLARKIRDGLKKIF